MELNSKKLERTSKIIYYTISGILCIFLILLSNRIIGDLDQVASHPEIQAYEDTAAMSSLQRSVQEHQYVLEDWQAKKNNVSRAINTARENYSTEKQSFDNWLQARKTLGSPDKDQEVISRAKRLDEYYRVEQDWRAQLNATEDQIRAENETLVSLQASIDEQSLAAGKLYEAALQKYEVKVFLIRLLFVAPVLALGIFFFLRYRKHPFWPIYFGFTLFSFYAFFFGLVPYLPSYGGYIRYSAGILLSAGLGYYAIKRIRAYMERKQEELKTSTRERAKNVLASTAEKALEHHICPSCGKDFMLKKWESPVTVGKDYEGYKLVTNFCRHCGLQLFKDCNRCGNKNFAHLPYCSSCGTDISREEA